jgi:hypothetical protein
MFITLPVYWCLGHVQYITLITAGKVYKKCSLQSNLRGVNFSIFLQN